MNNIHVFFLFFFKSRVHAMQACQLLSSAWSENFWESGCS